MRLGLVTLVVRDYDEAIGFYVDSLGFSLREDDDLGNGKRWVVVSPDGGAGLLLAKAKNDAEADTIGNQCGGRVGFFLTTEDFDVTAERFHRNGVVFCEKARQESYGKVAVFVDLYGNRWDLIEPKA
ncbi:MAG: VOC family protein [Pseudomonadota bacterium]